MNSKMTPPIDIKRTEADTIFSEKIFNVFLCGTSEIENKSTRYNSQNNDADNNFWAKATFWFPCR